jgi:hypothetical protein
MSIAVYRRSMTEAAMEAAIRELVERRGGRVFHVNDARFAPGMTDWPDLAIVAPWLAGGTVVFVELKSWTRRVTSGQEAVLGLLRGCTRAETLLVRSEPKHAGETAYDDFVRYLEGS